MAFSNLPDDQFKIAMEFATRFQESTDQLQKALRTVTKTVKNLTTEIYCADMQIAHDKSERLIEKGLYGRARDLRKAHGI